MEKDALIRELEKWARISRSDNPTFEIALDKVLSPLKTQGNFSPEAISELEQMIRHPEKLVWQLLPTLPDKPLNWTPTRDQVEWFRVFIEKARDGMEWHVPSTGQIYKIDKVNKTFTLIRDSELDVNDWHERNKMVLGLLGYSMIDGRSSAKTYSTPSKHWVLAVLDFSISDQENPATPGKNHPAGARGQDAMATLVTGGGGLVRLGHDIGRHLWAHVEPAYGAGKTGAAWDKISKSSKK